MHHARYFAAFLLLAGLPALAQERSAFTGRWDLTISTPKETYPSWMEVSGTAQAPEVRIVGRVASAHPAASVKLQGSHLTFTSVEHLGGKVNVEWNLQAAGGKLTGVQKRADGVEGKISAVRAPAMARKVPEGWSRPRSLFNGKDLNGWVPDKSSENHWVAENGELVNRKAGANLQTTEKFSDFKLHLEFNCPEGGNSGVYLRGRYEVQVEYETAAANDAAHNMGSLYGFLAPSVKIAPRPGQWESFDITLVGRTLTLVRDGITTILNQEISGITGGALDSHEGEPGPFYFQGDHTGGMKYRNITVAVPAAR